MFARALCRHRSDDYRRGQLACLGFATLLSLAWTAKASAAATVTYFYTNPQGTVLAVADAAGRIVAESDFGPYGRRVLGQAEAGPGFTGHVEDPDTSLVYMQARYFDPEIGRFLGLDPADLEAGNIFGFNRSAYANNNPMRFIDPDGKQSCDYCNQSVGPGVYVGASMLGAGNARAPYVAQVAALGANDNAQRSALKSETRANTPSMFRNAVEGARPGVGPRPGSTGRANVTNGAVNKLGSIGRIGGSVLAVTGLGLGALEVATSDNPTRSLAVVGGGLLGAVGGGEGGVAVGTLAGAAVGGPPGAVVGAITGGVAGSTAGAVTGRELGGQVYDKIYPAE